MDNNNNTPATTNQAVEKTPATVKAFFERSNVKAKFEEMMGKRASQFITSVLQIAATNLPKDVEPMSVYNAAAVAATLDLPLNNNLGFAYIVSYNEKYQDPADGQWKKRPVAQFQMGYKGFKQLALRSGQFALLHDTDVREGEITDHNRQTGEIKFEWIQDFATRESKKVIGYMSYFKLINGFEQTFYMPIEKIEAHARKYSQSFRGGFGLWKDDFPSMAAKTVTKLNLSKNAPLSIEMQKAIMVDQAIIKNDEGTEVTYIDAEVVPTGKQTQEEIEHDRMIQLISDCKTIEELALLQDANPNFDIKPFNDQKDIIISNLSNVKTDTKSKSK